MALLTAFHINHMGEMIAEYVYYDADYLVLKKLVNSLCITTAAAKERHTNDDNEVVANECM